MDRSVEHLTPYGTQGDHRDKTRQVRDMFDNIAPAYDRMNRLMTMGIDRRWRRRLVTMAARGVTAPAPAILDLATGTGDLAIALARAIPRAHVTGIDLSDGMIARGQHKVARLEPRIASRIDLHTGDALDLDLDDNSVDAVTIAFGIRNFSDLDAGYRSMLRVLRPGGKVHVLELTQPASPLTRPFYHAYTRGIIPLAGRLMARDSRAYTYLPQSIALVPARQHMCDIMTNAGFAHATWHNLTLGVATIYTAVKP